MYILTTFLSLLLATASFAQFQEGPFTYFRSSGLDSPVRTAIPWEGGFVLGGNFTTYNDSLPLNGVAFLRDGSISALGNGPTYQMTGGEVHALTVAAGELYAVGRFFAPASPLPQAYSVSRWDGTSWVPIMGNLNDGVWQGLGAVAVEFENSLVVVDGRTVRRLNNGQWQNIGPEFNASVDALAVYDGSLIAGGRFTMSEDRNYLARWDGQRWVSMDVGVNGAVRALLVHEGALYAAGDFIQEGIPFPDVRILNRVAVWRDGGWFPLGSGVPYPVSGLTSHNGNLLTLRTNNFWPAGPFPQGETFASQWDGTTWLDFETPFNGITQLRGIIQEENQTVYYGDFIDEAAGVMHVAAQSGTQLLPQLDPNLRGGIFSGTYGLTLYRGNVTALGNYRRPIQSGGANVATWDGERWQNLVQTGAAHESIVYAHNDTLYYARAGRVFGFDGASTFQVGPSIPGEEFILALTHHRGSLYAGGRFSGGLARFNGQTWERPVGLQSVNALLSMGDDLIIGGSFSARVDRNGILNRIARLTPEGQYLPLGEGFNNNVQALAVLNGELYAAGDFTASGNKPISKIARWDGQEWQPLGQGIATNVYALVVYGGHLIASGRFYNTLSVEGSPEIRGVARWTGTAWEPLVPGWSSTATAFLEHEGLLYMSGGAFNLEGNFSRGLIAWDGRITVSTPMPSAVSAGEVSVYPQPASRTATLQYTTDAQGSTRIEIFDLLGRMQLSKAEYAESPGLHTSRLDLSTWPTGTYLYRVTTPTGILTGTFVRVP